MRYGKMHVMRIIDQVVAAAESAELGIENSAKFQTALELIKEEHLLIDRRTTSLPEYRTNILMDFMDIRMSYKDIMAKYHCSMDTLKKLLIECGENDDRILEEMESRKHSPAFTEHSPAMFREGWPEVPSDD